MFNLLFVKRLFNDKNYGKLSQEVGTHPGGAGKAPFFKAGTTDKKVIRATLIQPGQGLNLRWLRNCGHRYPLGIISLAVFPVH